ncbi:hypothetical protein COUCH_25750 [Couchioplanes caeruleus]|uniref:hypothetical protein n=1 Tax=Couchioplanes caeruleus TaxID=56438 RepID=UPI0020C002BE|nr:hypothetical protein [Couchioplanes caeruleus]UQU62426.1 hypothetical protein COUCH_25750 [Couchioplanes caeruleus]
MSEHVDKLLTGLRTEALAEVKAPGAEQARRTVRRRRGIAASAGTVLAVTVILSGIALAGDRRPQDPAPLAPTTEPSQLPEPDPQQLSRLDAANRALGDPDQQPWIMATAGVVTADYENHVNDVPADDYRLFVYCAGPGTVDVVVKAGDHGDDKLAAGTVACSDDPVPGQLALTQPVDGYLRVFLYGDAQAAGRAGFSFKFVRTAEIKDPPSRASAANATTAAELLGGAGVAKVTTETDKTLDERRPAGRYLAGFACAGPGQLSFIIRSAKTLRDGTVATDGQTETAVTHVCTATGEATRDVPMSLPAGSAFTITAEADAAARNRAGWAYAFRPA